MGWIALTWLLHITGLPWRPGQREGPWSWKCSFSLACICFPLAFLSPLQKEDLRTEPHRGASQVLREAVGGGGVHLRAVLPKSEVSQGRSFPCSMSLTASALWALPLWSGGEDFRRGSLGRDQRRQSWYSCGGDPSCLLAQTGASPDSCRGG